MPAIQNVSRLSKRCALFVAAALLLVLVNNGWGGHFRTKARCRCGIPGQYEYPATPTTPPARAVSSTAVLLRGSPPLAVSPGTATAPSAIPQPQVAFFQLDKPQLAIDQCSISRVAVVALQGGRWRVSLQADQNPKSSDAAAQAAAAATKGQPQKQTSHIRRNEFHVVVRGYGANKLKDAADSTTTGKPLLFRIEMEPFWVQNGVPRDMVWDGRSDDVGQYFDLIDRVEIDFSYR